MVHVPAEVLAVLVRSAAGAVAVALLAVYDALYEVLPLQRIATTKNHEDRARSRSYGKPDSRSQAEHPSSHISLGPMCLSSRS